MTRETGAAIRREADRLLAEALRRQWAAIPGLKASFTDAQIKSTEDDMRYHLMFLASALWVGSEELFADYVRWVAILFDNLKLPRLWITSSLECCRGALDDVLPAHQAALADSYLDVGLATLDEPPAELDTHLSPDQPYSELAVRYLGYVLGGERHEAVELIDRAAESGMRIDDIYRWILQPVQLELGRLWLSNRISVALEHYATAVTQMAMSRLYGRMFTGEHTGRRVVAACIGGELHELGLRMVADFLEMDGWDSHYLGANTPLASIVETVASLEADLVALSATMSVYVPEVEQAIAALRADERTARARILVGGYPFNVDPRIWQAVGADGSARDADEAVRLAAELVAS